MCGSRTFRRTNIVLPSEKSSIFYIEAEMTPACVIPGFMLAWLNWTNRLVVIIDRTLDIPNLLVFKHSRKGRNSLTRTCAAAAL